MIVALGERRETVINLNNVALCERSDANVSKTPTISITLMCGKTIYLFYSDYSVLSDHWNGLLTDLSRRL